MVRDRVDLRLRRLEQGLTMQQLAERCRAAGVSVSVSEISRIERHIHVPRPSLRKRLAELLGVTVADIGGVGDRMPGPKTYERGTVTATRLGQSDV